MRKVELVNFYEADAIIQKHWQGLDGCTPQSQSRREQTIISLTGKEIYDTCIARKSLLMNLEQTLKFDVIKRTQADLGGTMGTLAVAPASDGATAHPGLQFMVHYSPYLPRTIVLVPQPRGKGVIKLKDARPLAPFHPVILGPVSKSPIF